MDGRRRLAEPVTEGAQMRPAAGTAPVPQHVGFGFGFGRWRLRIGFDHARLRIGFDRWRLRIGSGRGLDRHLRRLLSPVQHWRVPRGVGVAAATVFMILSVSFGIVRGGHLPDVVAELGDACDSVANAFGFRITSIALAGQRHLRRDEILAIAGITGRSSLLFLDAVTARNRLKDNPWIAEATVLKLYPGRLHIAITERAPFALWQQNGKLSVIAEDGTVIGATISPGFTRLPLVVGAGAGPKAREFFTLLDQYPLIRSQMRAAVLVAERRWNVVLNNGIAVRLPESGVSAALDSLVQLDRDKKLLTRDITAIDLRLPDRLTVRLSDEAYAARQETLKDKKTKKKAGAA